MLLLHVLPSKLFIPGGCTSLNVGVNKPLKDAMRKQYLGWLEKESRRLEEKVNSIPSGTQGSNKKNNKVELKLTSPTEENGSWRLLKYRERR